MTTLLDAKLALRTLGMTITKKDGEYRVNFTGGDEATAYYTNDIEDAISTARDMHTRNELVARNARPYLIALIDKTLTDGSHVYDVVLTGPYDMRFPCVSYDAAMAFIANIRRAIEAHTVNVVDPGFRTGFERE